MFLHFSILIWNFLNENKILIFINLKIIKRKYKKYLNLSKILYKEKNIRKIKINSYIIKILLFFAYRVSNKEDRYPFHHFPLLSSAFIF